MGNRRLASWCLFLLLGCTALPAWADGTGNENQLTVHSLTFTGVKHVDAAQLRDALATRVSSRWPWGRKRPFDRERFQADLERIHAFYLDRGFPDARVTSTDIRPTSDGTRVDLTVHVSEGQPMLVASVAFHGFDALPERQLKSLEHRAAVKAARPLDQADVLATHELAVNALRDQGFPRARVQVDQRPGTHPRETEVVFEAVPGLKSYFGQTDIVGNKTVSDEVVRRELLFKPGELYRRSLVQETQRKLYDLELFEFVNLQAVREARPGAAAAGARAVQEPGGVMPAPTIEGRDGSAQSSAAQPPVPPDVVPMRLTLTEGKHRRVLFSAGYGTEDKVRGEARYRQVNFLGGARTASVHAKWSSLDRGVEADLTEPFLFGPRWSFAVTGQRWYDNEPEYTSTTSGAHAAVTYRPGSDNSFSLTVTDEYDSSRVSEAALADPLLRPQLIGLGLDPATGSQDGTLVAVAFDARRSTAAPNPIDARRGYLVSAHVERAARALHGSFSYVAASVEARHYIEVRRRVIVASRVQAGSIAPTGGLSANVPFSKRYFLGGATSIRGWGRYEVSPLSGSGLPLGGLSMFLATGELRVRLKGQLGAVAFLDIGNVWADPWRVHPGDLRYAVGPGLRYNTPVGPVRFDVGYQLNPEPGLLVNGRPETRRWRIHFSIGQAF